ncbi:START-like domain protein [Pseudohyphozyma bogoriensis]|nr:START-like domain protein [Pseudohyphozyma bogoriensis]
MAKLLKKSKSVKSVKTDAESSYSYNPSFRDDESEVEDDHSSSEFLDDPSLRSTVTDDVGSYLQAAERAMGTLSDLHSSPDNQWKRVLNQKKTGVVVYVTKEKKYVGPTGKGNGKGFYAPVLKGELEIKGQTPAAVFGVVGTRKLWDDWYQEGNLVSNISDTSSLTYMIMKSALPGTSTRDLSLVEKVQGSPTGAILFASTSVVTPRVPRVAGRVRASIALNGWVLEPTPDGTRVTYYLHVNVKTFIPGVAAIRYLARRPTCIAKIADYLSVHGPPPMAGVEPSPTQAGSSLTRNRSSSISSKRSSRSTKSAAPSSATSVSAFGALPSHVEPNSEATNYGDVQKAQKLFRALVGVPEAEWSLAKDGKDGKETKILMRRRDTGLPIVMGQTRIGGVTTEQVLGTLLSGAARKDWDVRYHRTSLVGLDNGFDHGTHVESLKGLFPTLGARHFTLTRAVDRDDPSSDNGEILLVSRSTKAEAKAPKDSTQGQLDVSGWLLEDSNGSVKVTHVVQMDINQDVPAPIFKILVSEMARVPHEVREFIDDYGHAPFFIRWGAGPAVLESDEDGDLKAGKVIFKIGGTGKGTMKDGKQKSWLQWSDKMYERGVDVHIEPKEAAEVAKVDAIDRTLEFVWTGHVKDGATVTLTRASGDGADDVYVDGEFLDRTVSPEKGAGVTGRRRLVAKKARSGSNEDGDDVAAVAVPKRKSSIISKTAAEDVKDESTGRKAKVPSNESWSMPLAAGVAAAGTSIAEPVKSVVAPAQVSTKQLSKEGGFPEDACLIISKDLYFTRQQCAVLGGVVVLAYLWGKFT